MLATTLATSRHRLRWIVRAAMLTLLTATWLRAEPPLVAPQPLDAPAAGSATSDIPHSDRSAAPSGARGGGANADFDSLIDLITSTISTETWAETGGGEAEIRPFPTGVLVDAAGAIQLVRAPAPAPELAARRAAASPPKARVASDPRRPSSLRFVSLPRLEREIVHRQDAGQPLEAAMLTLAGLERVQYIFVYPETGDLVLAGPAGDWRVEPFGRIVSARTGMPVARLDDLLTLLRRERQSSQSFFGCAINPRQEALAATQEYLNQSASRPLEPRRRNAWLATIRDTLGRQDIEIFGIDPTSRAARVLVEADIHMKLIGMGLEEGVPGVESYLDAVKLVSQRAGPSPAPVLPRAGPSPAPVPPMSVLRWWFALRYEAIRTSPAGDAYQIVGPGVCVLSENELLAAQGQRIHTGQSDPLNRQFAESFTEHFAQLAARYPVYGELRAIFDLALVAALIEADRLAERAGWHPDRLLDAERLRLPQWPAPRETDTVANCVEINRRQIIAGVSGGVMVAPADTLARRQGASDDTLAARRQSPPPPDEPSAPWWWDAPPRH